MFLRSIRLRLLRRAAESGRALDAARALLDHAIECEISGAFGSEEYIFRRRFCVGAAFYFTVGARRGGAAFYFTVGARRGGEYLDAGVGVRHVRCRHAGRIKACGTERKITR